jgi:hypothetical protein
LRVNARRLFVCAASVAALVTLAGPAGSASAAEVKCRSTFHVLHNDHVGKMNLPKGHYKIILLDNQRRLTCGRASELFTRFLEDFDGKLPNGWHTVPATKTFLRRNSGAGFRVKRKAAGGGGNHGHHPSGTGKRCPGTFRVQHNDRIGKLKLPQGDYVITRLTNNKPTCPKASTLFARFLQFPSGDLPSHWHLDPDTASFTRRHTNNGFRVKQT